MLDSTHKKIVYAIFKDCTIISMYHQNLQLIFTNSKVSITNSRIKSEICSKLKRKTPEQHQLTSIYVILVSVSVNFGHI